MDLSERIRPDLAAFVRDSAPVEHAQRGATLYRERDRGDQVAILEAGFCMALKRTHDGQQQNVAFYVPGDILNHETFTLGITTSTIIALTPVDLRRISHARLRTLLEENSDLGQNFWRYIAFQGALAHEWILSLGRRPAFERMAHLLCELAFRMRVQAEDAEGSCAFPLTQGELADLLGLSVVHVNRTLQRLRQDGYIALRRGTLEILKRPELVALAGFDASYLDLADGG